MTIWKPEIDKAGQAEYYQAIFEALARDIDTGVLRPGDRLPPHRELSTALGVSVGTVTRAYAEAKRRGYIRSGVGSGTFVREHPLRERRRHMTDQEEFGRVDLAFNRPVMMREHIAAVQQAFTQQAESASIERLLTYHRPWGGHGRHRSGAAVWIERFGLSADPADVIITSGAQNAISVVLLTVCRAGDVVVTEDFCDPSLRLLTGGLGLNLLGLAIDQHGILPDAFEEACKSEAVRVLVCMPDHHSPTLSVWPSERRQAIAEIARRYGVIVIENAVYRPYLESAPPPLASLAREQSYYAMSFSKIMVPGLRVGYLIAPPGKADELVLGLGSTVWMASPIAAEILTDWIETGIAEDLVHRQREELAARNKIAQRILGGTSLVSLPTGLHVWLQLPDHWRSSSFDREARAQGVLVSPCEVFLTPNSAPPGAVRISLGGGAETRDALVKGLSTLRTIVDRKGGSFLAF